MKSVYGSISADSSSPETNPGNWVPFAVNVEYTTDDVAIATEPRNYRFANQAVDDEGTGVRCWIIGDVYGHDGRSFDRSGVYKSRPRGTTAAQFSLSLYKRDGIDFVRGLNGNFALLIFDPIKQRLVLCTDRFGTVPIYWTRADDGQFVFSTNVQTLPYHPAVDTSFALSYLHEYLAFRRTFGVKTPLEDIEKLEPGTVTTISLTDGSRSTDQYWRPQYQPREESFEWFVDSFAKQFQTVMDEWTRDDYNYGVLLSGGADSRLVLAGLEEATAFHMNDWRNREARIAQRVAQETGTEFKPLARGPQYRIDSLDRNRWAGSFNGWFTQPYTSGFEDEITGNVDALLSGLYSDSLFGGYGIPTPTVSLGPIGSMTVPFERSIKTVDEYIDRLLERAHNGIDMPTDLRDALERNIYREDDNIIHHGVVYDSLDELVYYGNCYPLSNDDDMRFQTSLRQLLPYRTPFLDNRLLDLSLSMPIRYRLRRNLIGQAIDRLNPDLAAIPHASTGVALSQPFSVEYVSAHMYEFWHKYINRERPPEPYLTEGPWLDDAELLRSFEFVTETLEEQSAVADTMPGLDPDSIRDLYRGHCRGENFSGELYTVSTLLTMPVTEHVLLHDTGETAETSSIRDTPAHQNSAQRAEDSN